MKRIKKHIKKDLRDEQAAHNGYIILGKELRRSGSKAQGNIVLHIAGEEAVHKKELKKVLRKVVKKATKKRAKKK
jgi:rubrerythrin